jgi:pantoate ligase / CMP/dCMP kinase
LLVTTTVESLRDFLKNFKQGSVGLVPTMGALHAGHIFLINQARQAYDLVVVSIFVNPLQFGAGEDYFKYPRNLESDRQVCEQAGVDVIFAPDCSELYGSATDETMRVVPPESMTRVLCGRSRIGHFTGVATVVTKLLNIIQPQGAYFGEKDGQQVAIIRRLVKDLNFRTEIIAVPTVRLASGLALSSRNQYLQPNQLDVAASLYASLQRAELLFRAGDLRSEVLIAAVKSHLSPSVALEYVELVNAESLMNVEAKITNKTMLAIAGRVGNTRLIDNIILNPSKTIPL